MSAADLVAVLAQAHPEEGAMDEYLHLMVDVSHVAFEISWEIITGIIVFPIAKRFWNKGKDRAIARHDAKYHPGEHPNPGPDRDAMRLVRRRSDGKTRTLRLSPRPASVPRPSRVTVVDDHSSRLLWATGQRPYDQDAAPSAIIRIPVQG